MPGTNRVLIIISTNVLVLSLILEKSVLEGIYGNESNLGLLDCVCNPNDCTKKRPLIRMLEIKPFFVTNIKSSQNTFHHNSNNYHSDTENKKNTHKASKAQIALPKACCYFCRRLA